MFTPAWPLYLQCLPIPGKKKPQYADSIDADDGSQVPAQIMIALVRKLQPRKTVRPSSAMSKADKSDKAIVKTCCALSKGMRSQSTRAKHKPGAQYKPTLVSIGNSRNEPIREIEEDVDYDEDDIEGLHMSSTTLSNGSVVVSGDWVLFKVDGKNCIGLYLKSVGYICQIDSCQLLGDGRYG